MANRIYWTPPSTPVSTYEVYTADTVSSALRLASTVLEDRTRPPFDVSTGRYYFDDEFGTVTSVYQVKAFDTLGDLVGDTGVFQPQVNKAAQLAARTKIDTNYGGVDALRYIAGGVGIPQALIRVYRKPDFDQGRSDLALYTVETDNEGRWATPIYLEPGLSYTLVFSKEGSYGPDKQTIIV